MVCEPCLAADLSQLIALSAEDVPLDQDVRDALDFASRGYAASEIGYSEEAPLLTEEQLAEFKPAAFRVVAKR